MASATRVPAPVTPMPEDTITLSLSPFEARVIRDLLGGINRDIGTKAGQAVSSIRGALVDAGVRLPTPWLFSGDITINPDRDTE